MGVRWLQVLFQFLRRKVNTEAVWVWPRRLAPVFTISWVIIQLSASALRSTGHL